MAEEFKKDPNLFDYTPRDLSLSTPSPSLSGSDKAMLALFQLINLADWTQTRQIARDPNGRELPISQGGSAELIGENPTRGRVNALFLARALAYPYMAKALPSGWMRNTFQAANILGQGNIVKHNQRQGRDIIR